MICCENRHRQQTGGFEMLKRQQIQDQRKEERYDHQSKVLVENLDKGPSLHGITKNYSTGGLYFESDTFIPYGRTILIGIYNSPYSEAPLTYECHRVRIQWIKELYGQKYPYGYGVELLDQNVEESNPNQEPPNPVMIGEISKPGAERRKHQRKPFLKNVYFVCNQKYYAGVTKDISSGGLFIHTTDDLAVGQTLNIAIPKTKFDKGRMLRAEIVRVEEEGIGVKIVGILGQKAK
jgi:hypothetical protein